MLTAIHNNIIVSVFSHDPVELRAWSREKSLFCPDCGSSLVFRKCSEKMHHFAHEKRDCADLFREGETLEHEKGKALLLEWLKTFDEKSDLEHHIPLTNQRADTFAASLSLALEFQCSPIGKETWETRRTLYHSAAISDIWILGYSMHTYKSHQHPLLHKLNPLEQAVLHTYGRITYLDTFTEQFIVLLPHHIERNLCYGVEYFFKLSDMTLQLPVIVPKMNWFLDVQQKRLNHTKEQQKRAEETNLLLQSIKTDHRSSFGRATPSQISLIKHLLHQANLRTYNLNGLTITEADTFIKSLKKEIKKKARR